MLHPVILFKIKEVQRENVRAASGSPPPLQVLYKMPENGYEVSIITVQAVGEDSRFIQLTT